MLTYEGLNYLAVLVVTVLGFVLGGLWYGPLFGKAWLGAVGKTEDDLGNPGPAFAISFLTAFVTAVVLGLLVNTLDLTTWVEGVELGLYVGVGFIATAMASDYAFCDWGKRLFFIQAGYRVAYCILMAVVLVLWR